MNFKRNMWVIPVRHGMLHVLLGKRSSLIFSRFFYAVHNTFFVVELTDAE